MDIAFVYSTALLFFMLMDPFGNLPVFITLLRETSSGRYRKIIFRESLFALAAMFLALVIGRPFLDLMHIQQSSIGVGGGLILLLIGIKMVFSSFSEEKSTVESEPFLVPIAIPFICGPGLAAILITIRNRPETTLTGCFAALFIAWAAQTAILLFGRKIAALLGPKMLDALESLLGLLLICVAVGMILSGINEFYGIMN